MLGEPIIQEIGNTATTRAARVAAVCFLVLVMCSAGCGCEPSSAQNVLKIAAHRDGSLTIDGAASTLPAMREILRQRKDTRVWYYREEPKHELAEKVLDILIDARVSLRLSNEPDYSDLRLRPSERPKQ
jgi:hypothetical protein